MIMNTITKKILKNTIPTLSKAQLLGYKNHAEYVLEERMAKSRTYF